MAFIRNFLGRSQSSALEEDKTTIRALPAPWYTSNEMYELERRSIFSKKWLMTTHKCRIPEPGDWIRYELAGFEFIVCQDHKGEIHAFHNVCRHRAFPIVTKDSGNNFMFSCQYHGWSYGLNGKLAKAPGYQDMPGFDKAKNSLLRIHTHIDINGFIWVNFDGKETPEVAWEDDFEGVDTQERYSAYNFDDYVFDHTWEMDGDYNWKILADNYNECYHCPTAHPDIPTIANLNSYKVETRGTYICHFGNPTEEQIAKGFRVSATYFFPNASMNVTPHFFFIQKFAPVSATKSTMRYEVYRNKNSSDEDFTIISDMYKRIMSEDKWLCANAQKNIQRGVFVNGEMHPKMEQGPLFFQKLVREHVTAHYEKEVAAEEEIWPARQSLPQSADVTKKDISFCSAVDCCQLNVAKDNVANDNLATEIAV